MDKAKSPFHPALTFLESALGPAAGSPLQRRSRLTASDPLRTLPSAAQSPGMKAHLLYWPSLFVATLGGVIVAVGAAYEPARSLFANPMTLLAAGTAILLFLRLLLDPRCHRGIAAANRELMGGHGFQFRLTPIRDPQWGIFGSRAGSPLLLTIRAVLAVELVAAMLLTGREGPDLLYLASASFFVVMLLSLINAGLARNASDAGGPLPGPR